MKNRFKIAAKRLIREMAAAHGLQPLDVLAIHKYARTQKDYNPANVFGTCLYAYKAKLYPKTLTRFLKGKRSSALKEPQYLKARDKFNDNRYNFAYDLILNFYVNNISSLFGNEPSYFNYAQLKHKIGGFIPVVVQEQDELKTKSKKTKTEKENLVIIPSQLEIDEILQPKPPTKPAVDYSGIKWMKQQAKALEKIYAWMRDKNRQPIFRLFGFAGTGKTFLAKAVAAFVYNEQGKKNVPLGDVLFASYTGKAASVLRRNDCRGATTLHTLLYKPLVDPKTGKCIGFAINPESALSQAAVLIVDEVSMVNEELGKDAQSFGIPILCLGDPGQLQPIEGYGYFTAAEPDMMLTDIRRQAKDNPIIELATRVREGKTLKVGKYGSSRVVSTQYTSVETLSKYDQILVGRNDTRRSLNIKMRKHEGYYALDPNYPTEGERLICLKNNKAKGLYNGTTWVIDKPAIRRVLVPLFRGAQVLKPGSADVLWFNATSEDELDDVGNPLKVQSQCGLFMFNRAIDEPNFKEKIAMDEYDFCSAITVHKAQGSQYKRVYIQDESGAFGVDAWRHLYTGITRGIDSVYVNLG